MNEEEFIRIANKVGEGSASPEELKRFNRFYNQYQSTYPQWTSLPDGERDSLKRDIKLRIDALIKPKTRQLWPYQVAAAAVLLCIVSIGIFFYRPTAPKEKDIDVTSQMQDIFPGSNRAVLTLADGSKVVLDNAKHGVVAANSGIKALREKEGQLIYQAEADAVRAGNNTIETPIGGQFQVQLPDGTRVWLNSSSRLTYPLKFSQQKRMVEVHGEAYFEVAHQSGRPFIVKTDKQAIEVLGTHFNVMAYAEEAAVKTTLVKGSVRVVAGKNSLVLKPGQQSWVASTIAELSLSPDVASAVAWKQGRIEFYDMNLEDIMRMLARWYSFEVEFKGKPLDGSFSGSFSRNKNLSTILKSLESTGEVSFKIEGRRVIVMR